MVVMLVFFCVMVRLVVWIGCLFVFCVFLMMYWVVKLMWRMYMDDIVC